MTPPRSAAPGCAAMIVARFEALPYTLVSSTVIGGPFRRPQQGDLLPAQAQDAPASAVDEPPPPGPNRAMST
ncbi:hypothetical protein [Pseudonocardia xinjiangensis]|uniref:Uncharacterized protein n=1 Tax=Pseudonocardia xinjiangensis TaxID=75289 RepID=A0ABX1R5Q7_9PSEU|nr:hypothetical protein [Pseudonocardia xinjiangensis]NMH75723.1 hypothetical protein [Pseudonocardia xinjiangensis]